MTRRWPEFSANVDRDRHADQQVSVESQTAQQSDSESSVFAPVDLHFSENKRESLRRFDNADGTDRIPNYQVFSSFLALSQRRLGVKRSQVRILSPRFDVF
jgi:hypothetical protein